MALWARLVKDVDEEDDLAITSVMTELFRYRRGTRGENPIKTNLNLTNPEWNDLMVINALMDDPNVNRPDELHMHMWMALVARENGKSPGINTFAAFQAEVQVWIDSNYYL